MVERQPIGDNVCGVYKITCLANRKIYVGQSIDIKKRWNQHISDLKGNYHSNTYLQRTWNKYQNENFVFEVLEECSMNDINEREIYWINHYKSDKRNKGFNIDGGGKGVGTMSDETKEKLRQCNLGKKLSSEVRAKISHTLKGRERPDDTRRKISISNQNKIISEETRLKISKANKGRLVGEKNPMYGTTKSPEAKKKHSEFMKGRYSGVNSPRAKKVICVTTSEVFGTAKEGGKKYLVSRAHICQNCKGERKSAGKHPQTGDKLVWAYYEQYKKGGKNNVGEE